SLPSPPPYPYTTLFRSVPQGDDLSGFEKADPIAQEEARREVLADREGGAADHFVVFDADLVDAEAPAEILRKEPARSRAQGPRRRLQRVTFAFILTNLIERLTGDQVRECIRLTHLRIREHREHRILCFAGDSQARGDFADLARRYDAQIRIVERRIREQQTSLLDREVLAIGL